MYQALRSELLEVPIYKENYNSLLENDTIDINAFMNIYSRYESEDRNKKIASLE